MGIYYKVDVVKALQDAGYTSYIIQEKHIMGTSAWERLRDKKLVSWDTLDKICTILQMQPGDIIDYEEDEE